MQDKKTLLIIDADVNLCEDMHRRFMLEPEFEIVGTATTAMDGFGKAQRLQPNFIILASTLPDADATQLISNIGMTCQYTKSIVALEVENPMLASQCMQLGAAYTLPKPYSADKLIEVIRMLDRRPANPSPFGQGQQQTPPQGVYQQPQMSGGPSMEQFRNAMNQFAQYQEAAHNNPNGFQQFQQPQGGMYQNQGMGQNFGMNQGMGQQFQNTNFNQMGGMNPGFNGGNFPPPQMPQFQQSSMQDQLGINTGGQRGGFRTIKQTIIAVNCPKGGVGKTTISKEMALAFATVKVGGQPLKVLLVDCNLDFGDITSMLKLQPYPNITHWTADIAQRLRENPTGEIRYTQQQIEKFLITHETGLKVLAAPSNHTDALDITGKEIEIVLDNLKNCDFDIIILDTGNNTKDYTIISLDKANIILMVTTLEVTTVNDTNLLLNTLRSIQFPTSKIQLVVNKLPKSDRDIDVSEISTVLRSPIIGTIPDFPKIRQINNAGVPAVLGKENEFTAAIRKIANTIVPVFNRAVPPQGGGNGVFRPAQGRAGTSKASGNGGGGFFGKLFGKK